MIAHRAIQPRGDGIEILLPPSVSITRLYEYYRNCGEKRREFVIAFAEQFREYLRKPDESSIHLDRRDVSTFFQRMAALYARDALPKELLMTCLYL